MKMGSSRRFKRYQVSFPLLRIRINLDNPSGGVFGCSWLICQPGTSNSPLVVVTLSCGGGTFKSWRYHKGRGGQLWPNPIPPVWGLSLRYMAPLIRTSFWEPQFRVRDESLTRGAPQGIKLPLGLTATTASPMAGYGRSHSFFLKMAMVAEF